MNKNMMIFLILLFVFRNNTFSQIQSDIKQQYISLGDFPLESGQIIFSCKIGYRTYGKLNTDKSNVIVVPTWFINGSESLEDVVPGKMVDTTLYHLILVDALGNGYSSSPSNSTGQSRLKFPTFTIKDMVDSQHKAIAGQMGIQHLVAVMGFSMGGMQALQWAVSYPDFMDKIISIAGSPQLSVSDLLLWNGELRAIERDPAFSSGNYDQIPALPTLIAMHIFAMTSPEYLTDSVSRDNFDAWLAVTENSRRYDWNNWHRQVEAIISHDITRTTKGTLEDAALKIKAELLIVVARQDYMVNPIPATQFAEMTHARILTLDGNYGHMTFLHEMEKVIKPVRSFLGQ